MQGDFRYIARDELKELGDSGLRTGTLDQLLGAVPTQFRNGVAAYKGTDLLAGRIPSYTMHPNVQFVSTLHALGFIENRSESGRSYHQSLVDAASSAQRSIHTHAGAAVWGQLMGPQGWFGKAMRSKLAATVQGSGACSTLFVHAGLLPNILEVGCRMPVRLYSDDDLTATQNLAFNCHLSHSLYYQSLSTFNITFLGITF